MENISTYFTNISVMTYLVVFVGGLATSFTPCVYPLIPIIIGVIGTSREQSKLRNFLLSLCYCLGLALTFSILGLAAALTGRLFGQLQASPVAKIIVGSIIILFGLTLLDVIALPAFLLSKTGLGKARRGGSMFSVLLMGLASGFVVAPCTAAVLGALLVYVASTQNIILGFTLLFSFALGLGTLLLIIGTFSGIVAGLPKLDKSMQLMQKLIAIGLIILGASFIIRAI